MQTSENPVHNFYAGPGKLPTSVLARIGKELHNYRSTGMSVVEISHRAKPIVDLIERTQQKFKELLGLAAGDEVLFLQGGGSMQFIMLAMNLSEKGDSVDYVDTGYWSKKAIGAALELERDVHIAGVSETGIPKHLSIRENAKYLHLCSNNTVMGTQWFKFPETDVPLVADMSSDILSRSIQANDFGLIYAHAQKTIGTSGVTAVIIPEKTREQLLPVTPSFLSYASHIEAASNYHTPPVFSIYVVECMLDWLRDEIGGVENMEKINQEKAEKFYAFIDQSSLFDCPVVKEDRSMMNVVFNLSDEGLTDKLLNRADANGMIGIKGHRSKGGLRVSLYNPVTVEDVEALIQFLTDFENAS